MIEKFSVYYTNDLHSQFSNWSQVATFMKQKKQFHAKKKESCWLFDIGDHVDRVHPIAEAFMGRANVQLLNDVDYDVVTIGNNEGITLSHKDLFHLYDDAAFNVVCTNLYNEKGEANPSWCKRRQILLSKHGVKVGVLGLTAPFNDYYELLGWHISPPLEELANIIKELQEQVDVIVLLSHLGLSVDQLIAREFPEVDVIIGGHTHHLLRQGEYIGNTLLTAAGKLCEFVGEVHLEWDHEQQKLMKKEAFTTNITHLEHDAGTEQTLNQLYIEAEKRLGKVITHIERPLSVNWFENTFIIQELTNTLITWTKADCAMLNAGLLLDSLPKGAITYGDIHRICPHPINPCVVSLTGRELMEVIRVSLTQSFMEIRLKGFGFRGEVIGKMVFAGMEIILGTHEADEVHIKAVNIQGVPLRHNRNYTVATADMFTFGRLLPDIVKAKDKKYFVPEFLRDLLVTTVISLQKD